MTLSGPKAYTTEEVIALCEEYGNAEADVSFQKTHDMVQPYCLVSSLPPHSRAFNRICFQLPCTGTAPMLSIAMHWHCTHATPIVHMLSAGRLTLTGSHATSLGLAGHACPCLMLQRLPPQVTRVPVWLLKSTRSILSAFQWARDAADRLVR